MIVSSDETQETTNDKTAPDICDRAAKAGNGKSEVEILAASKNDNYFESKKGSVPFDQLLLVVYACMRRDELPFIVAAPATPLKGRRIK